VILRRCMSGECATFLQIDIGITRLRCITVIAGSAVRIGIIPSLISILRHRLWGMALVPVCQGLVRASYS